jgi:hypothetical protein
MIDESSEFGARVARAETRIAYGASSAAARAGCRSRRAQF